MQQEPIFALLEVLRDPAILIDGARRVVGANPPARDMIGVLREGTDLTMSLRHPEILDAVGAVLKNGGSADAVVSMVAPVNQVFDIHVAALPSFDGTSGLVLCLLRDITVSREVDRLRSDFVANVSHELRSPLSSLIGFIETLQGTARDDVNARERFLSIMANEAQRMARLVDDLLSLSRVEAGEHIAPTSSVELGDVLSEVSKAISARAEEAGGEIRFVTPPSIPPVLGDRDELVEVFHNLVDNAVKYGSRGAPVVVDVDPNTRIPEVGRRGVSVTVNNRGDVIAPEHLPRLTERFYRIDKGRSRDKGGTGLGLAIVKHIVNRHRGRITIESSAENGNSFTVYLPLDERIPRPLTLS